MPQIIQQLISQMLLLAFSVLYWVHTGYTWCCAGIKRQMAIERRAGSPARSSSPGRSASPGRGSTSGLAAGVPGGGKPAGAQVRVITLNHGEHQDSTLYRLEKGDYLQFCPGPSLLGRKVFLYTNYVVSDDPEQAGSAEFVRNQYYQLSWWRGDAEDWAAPASSLGSGLMVTDTDMYCELRLMRGGAFHFYWVYESSDGALGPAGSGWWHVAPTLRVGAGGRERVPLDGITCQTVLTKCLGPLPRWEQTLKVARESGYNMVHFTPVQELGRSDSSYSIANQLRLDPRYGPDATFADVENLVTKMRTEWKMLSICDVVLNHTANETPWLREHPSATYNCEHVARLRPAALLDAVLARLTDDVARGGLDHRGVPANVNAESHLEAIRHLLSTQLIPELRLHEMYICNVSEIVQEFYYIARNKVPPVQGASKTSSEGDNPVEAKALKLIQDPQYRRLKTRVDMDLALQIYNIYWPDCYDEESRLKRCAEELKRKLDELNRAAQDEVEGHLRAAVDNCVAGMRYFRIQGDGPKIEEVSVKNPLVPRYFTWPEGALSSTAEAEIVVFGPQGAFVQAHNGWVMGADPLQDFAAEGNVYLRRELIAWGDSVKLRYGSRPEDSPFLWQHMREYVELTAEVFDGIRLDNCHSTPLPVAEYLIDCARNVKPDLYVAAELFTNSDQVDNIFVNRLGITSLIREAMSAWDSHELGRLVHRFGGRPVGAFLPRPRRAAMPQVAHALFLDLTHDNPSPVDKRSVYDLLPSAALVAMASCASGSTRGYDELVPHHIHVVDEGRQYSAWGEGVAPDTGLVTARRALNALHLRLAREGYDQVYVDQMDADIVAVTRHEPRARRSIILVSFTAFSPPQSNARRRPAPLRFEGELDEVLLEAALVNKSDGSTYVKHAQYINGLPQYGVQLQQNIQLAQSQVFSSQRREGEYTVLEFRDLAPGQIVVVKVSLRDEAASALSRLQRVTDLTSVESPPGLAPLLGELDLSALNVVLYRCEAEERDSGGGLYDVPGYGPLLYAGLQGVASVLSEIAPADDLGHPLCANLRAGDWLPDYMWQRLEAQRLQPLASWLREALAPLRDIPRYLHPAYFEAIVFRVHHAAAAHATRRCSDFVKQGCSFTRALALTSVQLVGAVPSASLPPPSPALPAPRPRPAPFCDTMSAGLPHFTTGYMRVWGRDTFVALRGLLLLTGRHDEARWHILGFGACLRHGLIPNLLDQGTRARFNCRDAVWWWLHAIRQYCELVPGGASILQDPVSRLFPRDDAAPAPPGAADQPLHRTIQEALDTHFQGLVFRERNAGRTIDAHMTDKGFNVQIGIDPDTGFPFGGNDANCGTWMDKMGSSEPAGTRGKPATPRDGSAIELVALAYSVAQWLTGEHAAGRYPVAGMTRAHRDGTVSAWTWSQWADRIHRNFERHFWVGPPGAAAESRPDLVHRRNIYKDSVGASQPWADYQLRSNYLVAMSVAPELFEPSHAWAALETAQRLLVAPLGVKTLDPDDWAYSPDYDNSNNSTDPKVAHGYNYHQGPEWLWPLGFYLTARLHFAQEAGCYVRTVGQVRAALGPLQQALNTDPWRGLPELTNSGGKYCPDSCRSQAWSSATILEVLYELERWERARPLPASD